MRKALLVLTTLFVTHVATAQTEKQKAFADSCNKAINYYKDFLIRLTKGQPSFSKGKKLFATSYKQLLDLKANDEVPVDEEQYELLVKALENMKSKDYKAFIATEQRLKDKVRVNINGKTAILSADNGVPLAVVLDILKNKLEPFQ